MAHLLGLIFRLIYRLTALLIAVTPAVIGYGLYELYTGAVDIDLLNRFIISRAEQALPYANVTLGKGSSAAFLPAEGLLRASFRDVRLRRASDGFSTEIPSLTLELRLAPALNKTGADVRSGGWFAAEAHGMKLLLPAPPASAAAPDVETLLAAETWARVGKLIPRVRALCAYDVSAAFVSQPEASVTLGKLCLRRRHSLSGADVIELEAAERPVLSPAEAEKAGPPAPPGPEVRLALSLYENGSAAVKGEFSGVGSDLFKRMPGVNRRFPLLTAHRWQARGALAFASVKGAGAQEMRLKLESADLPLPLPAPPVRGFAVAPPAEHTMERIILTNAEGYCLQSCTKIILDAPSVVLEKAKLKGAFSADLRLTAPEGAPLSSLKPGDFAGTLTAELPKISFAAVNGIAEQAGVARETLDHVKTYLKSGTLQAVKLKAQLPEILRPEKRKEFIEAEALFTEISAEIPQRSLKLRDVSGLARWRKGAADIRCEKLRLGNVTLSDLSFKTDARTRESKIEAGFTGSFANLKAFIPAEVSANSKKLTYIFAHTQAEAKGDLSLLVPPPEPAKPSAAPPAKPVLNLTATLTDAKLEGLSPALDAEDGTLWLDIRPGTTTVNGKFNVRRHAVPSVPPVETLLPINDAVATAEGPVDMELKLGTGKPDKSTDLHLLLDLSSAQLQALAGIYRKPAGQSAEYLLKGVSSSAGLRVDTMNYRSGKEGFTAPEGAFTPEGWRLRIARAMFGPHDVSAEATGSAQGVTLALGGNYLDGEDLLGKAPKPSDNPSEGPVWRVHVAPKKLRLRSALTLLNPEGQLSCRAGFCGEIVFTGMAEGGGPLRFTAQPAEGSPARARRFTLRAESPGGLTGTRLRSHLSGGVLEAYGLMKPEADGTAWSGVFAVHDFLVTDMPALGSLMTLATPQGVADLFRQQGMTIRKLSSPFRYERDVLYIDDAVTDGASLGFTGKGKIDLNTKSIDLEGLVVPSPGGVNRVVGSIPLLGQILTGGKDEGFIAMSYEVHGPFSEAQVRVNPFTAMTPGILRKVFNGEMFEP